MKINIKEPEIVLAITRHLATQGIVVQDRDIEMVFKAGRKGTGLSADISIVETNPTLPEVSEDAVVPDTAESASEEEPRSARSVDSEDVVEESNDTEEEQSTPKKVSSLFG